MTTTTIRPTSTQRDGRVRSSNAVYATVQTGSSLNTVNSTDPTTTGQRETAGTYEIFEVFASMDCSGISTAAAVTAASVEITFSSTTVSTVSDLEFRSGDAGALVETADWIDASTLASRTLYGTIAAASIATSTTVQCTLNADGIAAVQAAVVAGGYFSFVLVSKLAREGTAPGAGVDQRVNIRTSENATAGNRPALIVDHVSRPVMTTHYLNQMAG